MNPFEIRAQMLKMAQEYLQAQQDLNTEFAKRSFEEMVKAGKASAEDAQKFMPKMFSFDEITAKAKELYGFVSNGK